MVSAGKKGDGDGSIRRGIGIAAVDTRRLPTRCSSRSAFRRPLSHRHRRADYYDGASQLLTNPPAGYTPGSGDGEKNRRGRLRAHRQKHEPRDVVKTSSFYSPVADVRVFILAGLMIIGHAPISPRCR
jgi:hypothetical protein